MNQEELKALVGQAALDYVVPGEIVGVGTGSTVNKFIEALGPLRDRIAGAVSSSQASTQRLQALGIRVFDSNEVERLSVYIDPFGWQYRDYDIGWRLPARYYTARYWLQDPWAYRLPPVGGYYRWVRYYNDVLLVDVRNGRVLDRIQRFFW